MLQLNELYVSTEANDWLQLNDLCVSTDANVAHNPHIPEIRVAL